MNNFDKNFSTFDNEFKLKLKPNFNFLLFIIWILTTKQLLSIAFQVNIHTTKSQTGNILQPDRIYKPSKYSMTLSDTSRWLANKQTFTLKIINKIIKKTTYWAYRFQELQRKVKTFPYNERTWLYQFVYSLTQI